MKHNKKAVLLSGIICTIVLSNTVFGGSTTGGGRFVGGAGAYAQSTSQPDPTQETANQKSPSTSNNSLTINEIKSAQERLNQLGFDCGTADGIAGTKTKEAVKQFELSKGMIAKGEITRDIYDILMNTEKTTTEENDNSESGSTIKSYSTSSASTSTFKSKKGNSLSSGKSSYSSRDVGEAGQDLFNALQNAFDESTGTKVRK